jgi:hypothetical protein
MLKAVGAACRRAVKQTIRVLAEGVSLAIMLVLASAPAIAAIAVGCLLRNRVMTLALLAGASLGAFAIWRFRELRNWVADRLVREPSVPGREPVATPVVVPTMAPVTDDLLAFHDFDRVKNRFDHWTIGER